MSRFIIFGYFPVIYCTYVDLINVLISSYSIAGISGTPLCVKRRMFFLMVYGVVPEEPYTILKITQESTTQDVLTLCLQKAGINIVQLNDYILVEEVARGWEKKDHNLPATQRILDLHERPLQVKFRLTFYILYLFFS